MDLDPRLAAPARALVRSVSDSFRDALRERPVPLDVPRARRQHAAYELALRDAGVEIIKLPADEAHPDACFVEDCAVILDGAALISRPGAPSRLGEAAAIAAALAPYCPLIKPMEPPALLDGGDVLRVGQRLYVGRSARTNAAGIAALAEFAAPHGLAVVPVDLRAGLHLKSVVTLADPGTLVLLDGAIHPSEFAATRADILVLDEPPGANVLALGDRVLVSTAAPAAADRLFARGLVVVPLDIGEFNKADGAFTCLSLRIPPPGAWCA